MKRILSTNGRTLALIAVLVPLLILFIYVALRSGPLAPIPVTVTTVENRAIAPALFGIGTGASSALTCRWAIGFAPGRCWGKWIRWMWTSESWRRRVR